MKKQGKLKLSIRLRVVAMVFSVTGVTLIAGISVGYFWGFRLLRNTIGGSNLTMAKIMAVSIAQQLKAEIHKLEMISAGPFWKRFIVEQNSLYSAMPEEDIQTYLMEIDKQWSSAVSDSPLFKNYLENPLSQRFKVLARDDRDIAEIFVTDKFGGLVAASGKTSDFYQADEGWWQASYDNGRGRIFAGKIEFDASAGALSLPVAIPIKDDNADIIGICKTVIDISYLFSPLENLRIGKTGHALVIDESGNIIFHHGISPLSAKFLNEAELQRLFSSPDKWIVVRGSSLQEGRTFIMYADVPFSDAWGINTHWKVCIDQSEEEVFRPLHSLTLQLIIVSFILLALMIPLTFIFSGIFVKPIKRLSEGAERVGSGDLDYRVEIKTGDELEELADSFNNMAANLKKSTTSIDYLNQEIAERKKAEEGLRRLASIVESSDDAIIGKALDGTVISWNRGAEKLYGYSAEEAVGKSIKFLLPAERKDEFNDIIEKIKKGEGIEHFDTVRVKKDGGQVDVSLSVSPIYDSIGKIVGASAIARDISAAKSLSHLKDEFISTVSHELRTPLSITKEGISIILDRIAGEINKKQQDILGTARDNIDRLARIIDSLLDISKIEAGKLELQRKMININGLIMNVTSSFEGKIKAKGLALNLKVPKEEIQVYADKDKIVQVFTNLIGNSLKFTEKGFIEIGVEKKKNKIECYVFDSGIGISEEELPKAFSKFQQFGRKAGVGDKGTGLGLSIVKGIVEKHNGRIWAESELGKGSKFTFILPFYSAEKNAG